MYMNAKNKNWHGPPSAPSKLIPLSLRGLEGREMQMTTVRDRMRDEPEDDSEMIKRTRLVYRVCVWKRETRGQKGG